MLAGAQPQTSGSEEIGPYKVLGLVRENGISRDYKATDKRSGRVVVVRVMAGRLEAVQSWFNREATALAALSHPNIIEFIEAVEKDGSRYIVTEWVEGATLDDRQFRNVASMATKLEWMSQVCAALQHVHDKGFVHRDIKPANLVVARNGNQVKLIDFAIVLTPKAEPMRSGTAVGTVRYMSPEQIEAGVLDARSDIFSAACTLYELLTDHRPFEGADVMTILLKTLREPFPPLSTYLQDYPRELDQILEKALARKREERYATAAEFGTALEAVWSRLNP